jgi:hypothetical protein
MQSTTQPDDKTQDNNNPGQDEFKALIERNFSPGDERTMEERAQKGADDDKAGKKESEKVENSGKEDGEEKEQTTAHENQLGSGYKPSEKEKTKIARRLLFSRRQTIFGGGVVGTMIAVLVFLFGSGPLEFVHIAQLMEHAHFSAQQDQSDDRLTKLARYVRFKSSGAVEKTRLGVAQNAIADRVESKLNDTGIESSYSEKFGLWDGYVIDPAKLSTTEFKDLKGKSPAEVQQYFKDNFKVDIKTTLPNGKALPKGTFFADAQDLGYFQNGKLTRTMIRASGYSNLTSSISARIMGKRAGISWHPISIAKGKGLRAAEEKLAWKKDRIQSVEEGAEPISTADNIDPKNKNPTTEGKAQAQAEGANSVITDGQQANASLKNGDAAPFDKQTANLKVKLGAGGLAATGILCTLKGLDDKSPEIKESQVVLPLVREGGEAMAVGGQVMSGRDIDTTHLGYYKSLLNGKDHTGNSTSWIQAESIQAELGNTKSGVAPVKTLTTLNNLSPFHFLNQDPLVFALAPVCSTTGQIAQVVIGFLGGGITGTLVQLGVSEAVGPAILGEAAHWLAGSAIDPNAAGADYGNAINYGSRLAANAQAVSQGGRKLNDSEAATLTAFENSQYEQDFQSHNIAYKLFNPYDGRSAIAKIIDQQSPNVNQEISNVATALFNVSHFFTAISKPFTARAHAAAASYDYGFPLYGFGVDEMNDPAVKNPYQNADVVVGSILPAHPEYLDWANKCFGVTIDPTSFDITSYGTDKIDPNTPDPTKQNFYTNQDSDCNTSVAYIHPGSVQVAASGSTAVASCAGNQSDACNKLRVRFYIYDSENAESAACYVGNSDDSSTQQACTHVGFDEAQGNSSSAANSPAASGNAQQLAQQILSNNKITLSGRLVKEDLQSAAAGKPSSCNALISSAILKLIATIGQSHSLDISALESHCSGHASDSYHYTGDAVDFDKLDGTAITGRNAPALTVIDITTKTLPSGSALGQSNCGATPNLPPGWSTFADTCDHLHVQVPRGTP